MTQTELLAPAKNLECGMAAIDCGADAVYIGAAAFGARARAGNSIDDIETLVHYAHQYWARVYVTVNTLLYNDELRPAADLIHLLYQSDVDAVIIQDVGLLECNLPPIPLIASTQMHNDTWPKIAFLEKIGFHRVILARELDLEQIKAIRRQTTIELEVFVHGALCVSYSGQCYLSYAIGGRSGNRGECAQPCRRRYNLVDANGKTIIQNRHLLSLKDLNRAAHLGDLLDAGVTSFKIEGRLKDIAYVKNITSFYRRQLDHALQNRDMRNSSSGRSEIDWTPDPNKTFNRGYTAYRLQNRDTPLGAIDTPKMIGEWVGRAASADHRALTLDAPADLHNGDGLCFFDAGGALRGAVVHVVRPHSILLNNTDGIEPGADIYRNHDHAFLDQIKASRPKRKIAITLKLCETPDGLALTAADHDGNTVTAAVACAKPDANKTERMLAQFEKQLQKTGGTAFTCAQVEIDLSRVFFVPLSTLNKLRRSALEKLTAERQRNRPRPAAPNIDEDAIYPQSTLTYLGNVLNDRAAAFYRRHGVVEIEPAAESGLDMHGRQVMRTKYCIREQLGLCLRKKNDAAAAGPLWLLDEEGRQYRLDFDCAACEMHVIYL